MSDELRAACDKIRDLSGDVQDCLSGVMPHDTLTYRGSLLHELMEVSLVLRKNYLSEHPTEDESPITSEWLELIGLYRDGFVKDSPYTHRDSSIYFRQSRVDNSVWDVFVEVYDLGTVRTRGDVLRLLAALGIEATK